MLFSKNNDDIQRFLNMTSDRRKLIDETPATPIPKTYVVNELAKSLHPDTVLAKIVDKSDVGKDCKAITLESLENGKFPYFRAGQFVTLSSKIDGAFVTRPYSISSSPKDAMKNKLEVTVQRASLYSKYLLDEVKIGENILVGEPSGDFYHDELRDKNVVFAIAGGSGITPFISMIKSIEEGSDDFELIIVYGAKTEKDLLIKSSDITSEKVKLHIVLSDERSNEYDNGFITKEIIKKYLPEKCKIFMCGNNAMYDFVTKELIDLGIDENSIRKEHNFVGDREVDDVKTYKLTINIRDKKYVIDAKNNETLMTSMERAGILAPSRCRSGVCGYCHSRKVSGKCYIPEKNDGRRKADLKFGYIHPCCTYPESDMEIDVPPFNGGKKL